MIKAVVFDLDDTLISEKEYIQSGFKIISQKISKEYNLNNQYVYRLLIDLFNENAKNVFNRLLDKLNIKYNDKYIKELIHEYRGHMPQISLYEDAKNILEYLYNTDLKLGIITDGYAITQRSKLKVLCIEKNFDCVVVTDELGREYWKPHRKPYDIVKEQLGLEYEEMVYVGDNITKDFVTANKLGMTTVFISRKEGVYFNIQKEDEYKAKYSISDLKELVKVLNLNETWGEI